MFGELNNVYLIYYSLEGAVKVEKVFANVALDNYQLHNICSLVKSLNKSRTKNLLVSVWMFIKVLIFNGGCFSNIEYSIVRLLLYAHPYARGVQ